MEEALRPLDNVWNIMNKQYNEMHLRQKFPGGEEVRDS